MSPIELVFQSVLNEIGGNGSIEYSVSVEDEGSLWLEVGLDALEVVGEGGDVVARVLVWDQHAWDVWYSRSWCFGDPGFSVQDVVLFVRAWRGVKCEDGDGCF